MPLPTELYEKAAAGFYTLDEVLRMEQVSEIESLDPAQLLGRLSDMAGQQKEATAENLAGDVGGFTLLGGAIGAGAGALSAGRGNRLRGALRGGLTGAGTGALSGAFAAHSNDSLTDLPGLGARLGGAAIVPLSLMAGGSAGQGKGFMRNLRMNPKSDEVEAAFMSFEKKTGRSRNEMTHDDIADHVEANRAGKEASAKTAYVGMMIPIGMDTPDADVSDHQLANRLAEQRAEGPARWRRVGAVAGGVVGGLAGLGLGAAASRQNNAPARQAAHDAWWDHGPRPGGPPMPRHGDNPDTFSLPVMGTGGALGAAAGGFLGHHLGALGQRRRQREMEREMARREATEKGAMNPNFNLKAFKDRMANGGKALKPAMSGFGAGKGPSDMTPGWANTYERVNGLRASGGNVLKELATKKAAASMHSPGGAALIGAAGGAVLGGAVGAAKKPKDGSSRVSRGLRGAGAGALVGGVSGLVAGKNREGREAASLAGEMLGRKTAAEPWDASRVKDVATHALVHGGVGLGLGLGGVLAHRGVSALANKVTAPLDRNRILSVHPSIERENTPEQISLAYNSLRQFAPHITKDPLAGGNALSQILRTRDALDPSAPPRISGANVMAELGAKSLPPRSEFEPSIMTGMMSGAQGAMGAEDKQQSEIGTKQPHAREMEYLKDHLARGRDTSSQQNAAHARTLREYLANRYQHSPEEIENILGGSWNP